MSALDPRLRKRVEEHPITALLRRAQHGQPVHTDELDDLRLPARHRGAMREALERVQAQERRPSGRVQSHWGTFGMRTTLADELAAELVASLPPEHETTAEYHRRRANDGDPASLAWTDAQKRRGELIANEIMGGEW